MGQRLIANWVYGGFLMAIVLLLLTPTLTHSWPRALMLVYLCLPAYMLHQYEEHDNDRFRAFVNGVVFHGKNALTRREVFIINTLGVWGVIAVALALAERMNIGYGLIAVYLMLLNGISHAVEALVMRCYNPGLITSIVLFLPLGVCALVAFNQAGGGTVGMHLLGAGSSVAIHAAIVARVLRNVRVAASA